MRFRAPESSTYMLITPALDGIKSYTSVIAQLINPIVFSIKRLTFAAKVTLFSLNHQEKGKNSASHQQNLPKSAKSQTEQVKICVICEICVTFISRQKALQEEDEVEIYMFG